MRLPRQMQRTHAHKQYDLEELVILKDGAETHKLRRRPPGNKSMDSEKRLAPSRNASKRITTTASRKKEFFLVFMKNIYTILAKKASKIQF